MSDELLRFNTKGMWNGAIERDYEFIINKFNAGSNDEQTGIEIKILSSNGKEVNAISFNPFAYGNEVLSKGNYVVFEKDGKFPNKYSESITEFRLKELLSKEKKLDQIKETFRLLSGKEEFEDE